MTSESASQPQLVIWGTNINMHKIKIKFQEFIKVYMIHDEQEQKDAMNQGIDITEPYYMQKLEEMHLVEDPFFNFDCSHLKHFNVELYKQLICYPIEVMEAFDTAVKEFYFTKFPNDDLNIRVRPYNVDKITSMRMLNPSDIDQLITMTGMIIRLSNIIPEMAEAFFKCTVCSANCTVKLERGRILEPTVCQTCSSNHSYELIHNRCTFYDKQLVKLQESPDEMPAGETPCTTALFVRDDLVDSVQPGDRVEVTGIYRAVPLRVNPRTRNFKSVYKTYIEVLHFKKKDNKRLYEVTDETDISKHFTPESIMKLRALSKEPGIYDRLARAIAPDIFENDDIKKGILLQLFGGTPFISDHEKSKGSQPTHHPRSEVNILLCGDPGTSKSQLLQYVYRLVPRAQYTSGKGSSAVGLTAFISKDVETNQYVLQTGALVLADNGVCCIDEFDKMSDYTRAVLHEVMEQQTLSIAKCGIICKLNARTSILAAANPIESKWAKNKTIVENIQLPHTLMSRFDLIFLILDPEDELYDRRLASHLVSLYHTTDDKMDHASVALEMDLLKDYIMYAKTQFRPKLSEESGRALTEAYLEMRKLGSGKGQITAYPRQLHSLIRLAEAHAKMRFSNVVEVCDVEEAKRLHREALKQSAIDPKTGRIDVGILTTGYSSEERRHREQIAQTLKKLIKDKGKITTIKKEILYQDLLTQSDAHIQREHFESALRDLQEDDYLIITDQIIRILSN
jgi:DNA replication licensing factor MCM4